MTTSPSLDEFLSTARREFGFLVSEFRFTGQPDLRAYPNPFSVHYVSSSTAVAVDGTQWGFGLQVMLTFLAPPPGFPPSVPLWAMWSSALHTSLRVFPASFSRLPSMHHCFGFTRQRFSAVTSHAFRQRCVSSSITWQRQPHRSHAVFHEARNA
jgi:hypothetical protein